MPFQGYGKSCFFVNQDPLTLDFPHPLIDFFVWFETPRSVDKAEWSLAASIQEADVFIAEILITFHALKNVPYLYYLSPLAFSTEVFNVMKSVPKIIKNRELDFDNPERPIPGVLLYDRSGKSYHTIDSDKGFEESYIFFAPD
jgi:hypothetical protein